MISPLRPSRWGWRSAYDAVRETKVVLSVGAAFPDWDDVIDGDALWMRM